jgi:hypothetical protein
MALSRHRFPVAVGAALGLGLVFRLWLVQVFPYEAGDTPLYEALARSLVAHGAYALPVDDRLVPVNVRMPGYPALLAASHVLFGPGYGPVRVAQAVIDTLTCLLSGLLAALLAGARRRRAFVAGVWLAAMCPFTANYAAAILAETAGAFWTAAALALLLAGLRRSETRGVVDGPGLAWYLSAGFAAGVGCYFRPETPLVLIAGAVVLSLLWRRRRDRRRLVRSALGLGLGLTLALAPWAARNLVVLGHLEVLPPPAANLPGEIAPLGFNAWTGTWLTTVPQIYAFQFKIEDEPLRLEDLPDSAVDTPEEKDRVARLFAEHNDTFTLTRELDGAFAQLARERTARHPLRTFLLVPLARVRAMWIAPRLELLPFSGRVLPVPEAWAEDPVDLTVTVVLFSANLLYLILGAWGAWRAAWRPGAAILVVYVLLRTALITQMPAPEPRYVVICFPLLAALGAQLSCGGRPRERSALAALAPGRLLDPQTDRRGPQVVRDLLDRPSSGGQGHGAGPEAGADPGEDVVGEDVGKVLHGGAPQGAVLALHRGPRDLQRPPLQGEGEQGEQLRQLAVDGLSGIELPADAGEDVLAKDPDHDAALVQGGEGGRRRGPHLERGIVERGGEALGGPGSGARLQHPRDAPSHCGLGFGVEEGVHELAGDARGDAAQRAQDVPEDLVRGQEREERRDLGGPGLG